VLIWRGKRGFTLIEIAIVLVIVGLLITGTIGAIQPLVQNSRVTQTGTKLDRVELALLAYVIQNGCLPCPGDPTPATGGDAGWSQTAATAYYGPNYTSANRPCASPGTCLNTVGILPWNVLGLRQADAIDAWQDYISYAVTSALTVDAGASMVRTPPVGYPAGTLTVANNSGTNQTTAAAYVLISHGADRSFAFAAANGVTMPDPHGVTTTNQQVNSPAAGTATTFRQDRPVKAEGASYFDDIVRYRTAPTLIQECGKNACGNPS